jgi:hypothetical protein
MAHRFGLSLAELSNAVSTEIRYPIGWREAARTEGSVMLGDGRGARDRGRRSGTLEQSPCLQMGLPLAVGLRRSLAGRGLRFTAVAGMWLRALVVVSVVVGSLSAAAFDRGADGEFEKRTSSHFVLLQDVDIDETSGLRGSRRFEQEVLTVLEAAYDRLDAFLGLRPRRPITVVIYDPEIFDREFSGLFRFAAAGFYSGTIHVRGDTRVYHALIRVLHHELVHAAFDAEAPNLLLPAWFNEGVAEWFGARAVGQQQLSPRQLRSLSGVSRQGGLFAFRDLSSPSLSHLESNAAHVAYLQSYAFIEYLARLRDKRFLRELCRDVMRKHDLDRALQRTYRANLNELQASFAADLRGRSGG